MLQCVVVKAIAHEIPEPPRQGGDVISSGGHAFDKSKRRAGSKPDVGFQWQNINRVHSIDGEELSRSCGGVRVMPAVR
jgi:hypothetical protein